MQELNLNEIKNCLKLPERKANDNIYDANFKKIPNVSR